jgi:hypothetical protein
MPDWRLLLILALGGAALGGGLLAVIGSGPRQDPEVAVWVTEPDPSAPTREEIAARERAERAAKQRERDRAASSAAADELAASTAPHPEPPVADPRTSIRQTFREFKAAFEEARNFPAGNTPWNLGNDEEQRLELCKVQALEIEPSLPNEFFRVTMTEGQWSIACEGEGPWTFVANAVDNFKPPIPLGNLSTSDEGMLTIALTARPETADADDFKRAREALTTLPLILRLKGETSAEFETHVQLRRPARLDPIKIPKFLTDAKLWPKGNRPGDTVPAAPLPTTPWLCAVELHGRAGGGAEARVESTPLKAFIAQYAAPEKIDLVARWTLLPDDEPFMKTVLLAGNRDGGYSGNAFELQLMESEVMPPWNEWNRLGEITTVNAPKPLTELPDKGPAQIFKQKVTGPDDKIPHGTLALYAGMARQYVPKMPQPSLTKILPPEVIKDPKSLADWKEPIRQAIKAMPGYQAWVDAVAKAPDGSPPDANTNPGGHKNWKDAEARHKKYAAAGEPEVREFWTALQGKPEIHARQLNELILCCLHFEIEEVLAEKRKAKALLEAVGEGTVTFTGQVWVDPANDGLHRVLLAEFRQAEPEADLATAGSATGPTAPPAPDPPGPGGGPTEDISGAGNSDESLP